MLAAPSSRLGWIIQGLSEGRRGEGKGVGNGGVGGGGEREGGGGGEGVGGGVGMGAGEKLQSTRESGELKCLAYAIDDLRIAGAFSTCAVLHQQTKCPGN